MKVWVWAWPVHFGSCSRRPQRRAAGLSGSELKGLTPYERQPSAGPPSSLGDSLFVHNKGLSRHESVIINRLRIGHTRLTHSYLLSSDDQPTCSSSTYSPSYTVGLCRSAGCPPKTLLCYVSQRFVWNRRQSYCYWFYQRNPLLQLTVVYHPTFVVAFNSVYHTAVVLCTHLLISKTILLIYFFT